MKQLTVLVLVALSGPFVESVVIDECELGQELKANLKNPGEVTVGKIVCHASQTSNFNTNNVGSYTTESREEWATYGIFGIPNPFCDGQDPALSICGHDCTKLTDDIITDDIECVNKIMDMFLTNPTDASIILREIIKQLFSPYCLNINGNHANCPPANPPPNPN